ncbi:MAG: DUF2249 domain-containing protein [Bryobacteraceae bacterium]
METLNILERVKFDSQRPVSQALFQGPGPKVMLVCLKAGQKVPEHAVPVQVIVQTVSGRARFYDGAAPFEMTTGSLLRLDPSRPHAVEAIEDSILMATILSPGAQAETNGELDLRQVPRGERHPLVFAKFDSLVLGDHMVLVNDHDPKPLHMQFDKLRPGEAEWSYLEQGPEVFRIRISRTAFASPESGPAELRQRS